MPIYKKLKTLQQKLGTKRDKHVSYTTKQGKLSYSYTTLTEFWETVEPLFDELDLLLNWSGRVHSVDPDVMILVTKIIDLEDETYVQSEVPLRFCHADFRADGARNSYWSRMAAIRLSGLIDDSDTAAETYGGTNIETTTTPARGAKNKRPPSDDSIVY